MKKKKINEIKKIIDYDENSSEHKRLIRKLKKEYQKLPKGSKVNLIDDLKRAFKKDT